MSKEFIGIAPGRVNLIGEHTDYNGGWVLPTAIPQQTIVRLKPRNDRTVLAQAQPLVSGGTIRSDTYRLGEERKTGNWLDYLQGVTKLLREMDLPLQGAEIAIESTVPEGSGLSSSAALVVALFKAWREAFSLSLSDLEIAKLAQRVENEFVGARVGIMDPMAVCFAKPGSALFLDTESLNQEAIPLPAGFELLVIGSGISHRNVGGGYNTRRAECEAACKILGVNQLREIESLDGIGELPDILRRRVSHVVQENARVHSAVLAIRRNDPRALGSLFVASHFSLRDDYEVSVPEIDTLVNLCLEQEAIFGARLTGGGFGGSIVAITRPGEASRVANKVMKEYEKFTGAKPQLLVSGSGKSH